jgi:peroxiredoxin
VLKQLSVSLILTTLIFSIMATPGGLAAAERGGLSDSLKAGDKAPLFALPDVTSGKTVSLADLLERGPVVLFFYRGGWCPFCNVALAKMSAALPEFKALGASVVAISPQLPEYATQTGERHKIEYYNLSDAGLVVARQFGLQFSMDEQTVKAYKAYGIDLPKTNGGSDWELPVPGYYVIDRQGVIRWAYANEDYKVRPEPEEIIAVLKGLK